MEKINHSPFSLSEITIRQIQKEDNPALANVIRTTLKEFGANHPGTVYYDDSTDHLYEVFATASRAVYYVALHHHEVLGGAGIFPTPGLDNDTCELVKMYLLPPARGIGLGRKLIEDCLAFAKDSGYRYVYLETMPELEQALKTYEKFGFTYLSAPMGNSGHFGCEKWMRRGLF